MENEIELVPQDDQGFNDTYGTKFSGAKVLEEMALDFEANPQPFSGYDHLNIEHNDDSMISDSFENLFDRDNNSLMNQNLINMQAENNK